MENLSPSISYEIFTHVHLIPQLIYPPVITVIWQGFTWPVIMSLVPGISTVIKHGKWSYKSQKKGLAMYFTWPLPVTLLRV